MAPKRKKELANPEDDTTMEPKRKKELAKPVYLVALRDEDESPYCVIEIDAAADESRRARTVAGLPGTERGMSFVATHSKHGSWIVGVGGGLRAGTIIFDPSTSETYQGPRLSSPKHSPVLISHVGVVYAISRSPRVVRCVDSEPWFESLSFNSGVPSKELGVLASWSFLPPPPFFPSLLDPFEFRNRPAISVTSYAAFGSHILVSAEQVLSPQQGLTTTGTYAFHVLNETWEKVHNNNLPFLGQAVPLGGSLFAACPVSSSNATASVFHRAIEACPSTTPSLSIQEFPAAAAAAAAAAAVGDRILFCPLGKDSFCSIRLGSISRSRRRANCLKGIQVILTSFQTERQAIFQSHGAEAKDLRGAVQVVNQQSHTYKTKGWSQRLLDTDMPVVAALSM